MPTHSHKHGIPRTLTAALRQGFTETTLNEHEIEKSMKLMSVQISEIGARPGVLCGIHKNFQDDTKWLVCYKDKSGQCKMIDVAKGDPV